MSERPAPEWFRVAINDPGSVVGAKRFIKDPGGDPGRDDYERLVEWQWRAFCAKNPLLPKTPLVAGVLAALLKFEDETDEQGYDWVDAPFDIVEVVKRVVGQVDLEDEEYVDPTPELDLSDCPHYKNGGGMGCGACTTEPACYTGGPWPSGKEFGVGDLHWLKDLPIDQYALFDDKMLVTPSLFGRIGNYTQSMPTGASPGRVYIKNLGWPKDMDDNWFAYICERDPDDEKYVLHKPRTLMVVDFPNAAT